MRQLPKSFRCGIALFAVSIGLSVTDAASADVPMDFGALSAVKVSKEGPTHAIGEPRERAVRQGAWSYGARGGLSHRTWEISNYLRAHQQHLDQVFDFRSLLIALPSGLLLQPPVYIEGHSAFEVTDGGQQAALTDVAIFKIEDERIVPTAKLWGNYLLRQWPDVAPPEPEVFPATPEEEALWKRWLKEGWDAGVQQADETFQSDLDRMVRDFVGMVRFRHLYAEGMVSMPFTNEENRGITGGGRELRIGDRGVRITGQSVLLPKSDKWRPADH